MTQVTGILTDEVGTVLANTTCAVVAIDQVVGQDGGGRVSRGSIVVTDGAGEFDADIKPGRYELVVEVSAPADANVRFSRIGRLTVLTTGPMTLEEALDTSFGPINPSILQQAIEAKDAAEAAAVLAQSAYQGRQYATRAEFVSDTDYTPDDGTIVFAANMIYVAFAGATAIPDKPGFLPGIVVYPDHFAENLTPGTTDMTTAIQAAIDYANEITLRAGDYRISNPGLRISKDRTVIKGAGKHATRFIVNSQITSGSIIHIEGPDRSASTIRQIEVSHLSIWCNAAQAQGPAFLLRDLQHFVCRDVHLRNVFAGWDAEGLQQAKLYNTDIFNSRATVLAGSFYFKLRSTTGAAVKNTEIYINDPNWRNVQAAPVKNTARGIDLGSFDGVWINGGHIMGCESQLYIEPDTATSQCQGIEASNVWFDMYSDNHIRVRGNTSGGFGSFMFTGCKGLNADVISVDVGNECTNLARMEFVGGSFGTRLSGSKIAYIGAGSYFKSDGVDWLSSSITSADPAVEFGAAAVAWSVDGGNIGAGSGSFAIGIKADSNASARARINGVGFANVSSEVQMPARFSDGSKISGLVTSRNIATASAREVAASITLIPVVEVVTLTGGTTPIIENLSGGWDGRQVMFVAGGGTAKTFGHNLGAAGTNIVCKGFANLTIDVGRFATAIYRAAAGVWYVQ